MQINFMKIHQIVFKLKNWTKQFQAEYKKHCLSSCCVGAWVLRNMLIYLGVQADIAGGGP